MTKTKTVINEEFDISLTIERGERTIRATFDDRVDYISLQGDDIPRATAALFAALTDEQRAEIVKGYEETKQ